MDLQSPDFDPARWLNAHLQQPSATHTPPLPERPAGPHNDQNGGGAGAVYPPEELLSLVQTRLADRSRASQFSQERLLRALPRALESLSGVRVAAQPLRNQLDALAALVSVHSANNTNDQTTAGAAAAGPDVAHVVGDAAARDTSESPSSAGGGAVAAAGSGGKTSLRELTDLDLLKRRTGETIAILEKAETLLALRAETENVFSRTGDIAAIAAHVDRMAEALEAVRGVPFLAATLAEDGPDEGRRATEGQPAAAADSSADSLSRELDRLRARLEGTTRPQLLGALTAHDSAEASSLARLFVRMNREKQLLDHFYRCVQLPLEEHWNGFRPNEAAPGGNPENPLVVWLPSFFEDTLVSIGDELEWSRRVFSGDTATEQIAPNLAQLTLECMKPLRSSFERRVDSFMLKNSQFYAREYSQRTRKTPLSDLVAVMQIVTNFAQTMLRHATASAHSSEELRDMVVAIVTPLFKFQRNFGEICAANVERAFGVKNTALLPSAHLSAAGDDPMLVVDNCVTTIDASISPMFQFLGDMLDGCVEFTSGAQIEVLFGAASKSLKQYLSSVRKVIEHIRKVVGVDHDTAATRDEDEWSLFQGALRLLPLAAKISRRVSEFETQARAELERFRPLLLLDEASDPTFALSSASRVPLDFSVGEVMRTLFCRQSVNSAAHGAVVRFLEGPQGQPGMLALGGETSKPLAGMVYAMDSLAFDAIFGRVRRLLAGVPTLSSWSAQGGRSGTLAITAADLPEFSLAPQDYATQTGELLLMLPQQLEPFGSIDTGDLSRVRRQESSGNSDDMRPLAELLATQRSSLVAASGAAGAAASVAAAAENAGSSVDETPAERGTSFVLEWISAICRGAMSWYASRIVEIPRLSDHGARQLLTDVEYLINVVSALGVPVDESLSSLQGLLPLAPDDLAQQGDEGRSATDALIAAVLHRLRTAS